MGQAAEAQIIRVKEEREQLADSLRNTGCTLQDEYTGKDRVVGKGYGLARRALNKLSPQEQLLLEMSFCETYDIDFRI